MEDFLSFRRMITPIIIQIVFWIGVIVCVLVGLGILTYSAVAGLLVILLGPLVVRLYCELMIVIFRISETLTDILHEFRKDAASQMRERQEA